MSSRVLNFDNFITEKNEEPILVTVFGKEYKVKPQIPAIVPVMMARSNENMSEGDASRMVLRAADIMFGKEAIEELCEKGISVADLGSLIKHVFDMINGTGVDDDDAETLSDEDGMVTTNKAKK